MTKRIVVTGASGTIGQRAVTLLVEKKAQVAALVRDPAKAAALAKPGVALLKGSFENAGSLRDAFSGADTVVSITPANVHATEQAQAVLDAARTAGVRKLVRVSALKADVNGPTDNTRQHGRHEAAIRESGLAFSILRPHLFMQNLLGMVPGMLQDGALYWGTGDGKMGLIDTRDASDAVAVAATSSDFDGQTLELTGPRSMDFHEVAKAISVGLGKRVRYVPVPPEAAGEAVRKFGADEWTATLIRDYCTAYSKGFGDFTTNEVERITGHAPRSIEDFVREVLVPAAKS